MSMNNKYDDILAELGRINRDLVKLANDLRPLRQGLRAIQSITKGGGVVDLRASGPDAPKCGHVYNIDGDDCEGDTANPCVLESGHADYHTDARGDTWGAASQYSEPDPMEVGRVMHEAAATYVGSASHCAYPEPEPKCGAFEESDCGEYYPCTRETEHKGAHLDRHGDRWVDDNVTGVCGAVDPADGGDTDYPCIMDAGHAGKHVDKCEVDWTNEPENAIITAVDKYLGGSKPKCGNVFDGDGFAAPDLPCILQTGHEGSHRDARDDPWSDCHGYYPEPVHGPESWSDDVKKAVLGCVLGVQVPRESFDAAFGRFVAYVRSTDSNVEVYPAGPVAMFVRISLTGGELVYVNYDAGTVWGDHTPGSVGTIYGPPEGYGLVVENGTVRVGGKS